MMERIEITTRFSKSGKLIPLDFTFRDQRVGIISTGRQWESEYGRHILVMDIEENTHHLFFKAADLNWYLVKDRISPPGKV